MIWLTDLLDAVTSCMEADSPMGRPGLRYQRADDFWEIWIYPTPVELVGGARDGAVLEPGFVLNVEQLRMAFDSVVDMGWNALGLNFVEGPHFYVEGAFGGRELFLQVLAHPPEGEEPGLKLNATKKLD